MPPAKKTTARKTTQQPAPPVPPANSEPVVGLLNGREVSVKPVNQWRNSAMRALRSGDIDTWADMCLTDEGYEVFEEEDPTLDDIAGFFSSIGDEMASAESSFAPPGNRQQRRAGRRR
ncbi:hypothetical protein [Streptomyces sp. NPDC007905]|uniref:hypothetical protein n=1 Tax=Streptomyces sp. NPDC007905 TaxID=3364788 RepID=UPI0036F0B316